MTVVAGGLITLEYALEGLTYGRPTFDGAKPSARDIDVMTYIVAATPVIENLCGPILAKTITQRRDGGKSAILLDGRVKSEASITAVRVDGAPHAGHVIDADSGIIYAGAGRTFPGGLRNVEVDLTVGFDPVPQELQLAARELVVSMIQGGKQAQVPVFDIVAGASSTGPSEDVFLIPRRVRQLCATWRQGGFA